MRPSRTSSALVLTLLSALLVLLAPPAASASTYTVTASAKRWVVLSKPVKITGTVTPAAAGQVVTLQVRYGKKGSWTSLRTATIASGGTYAVKDVPSSTRTRWYRVLKPASGNTAAGVSPELRVQVYQWQYLTDRRYHAKETFYAGTLANINGKKYPKSVRSSFDGWIEYNVNRRCRTLTGVTGLDDSSETGAQARIDISGDGNLLSSKTYGVGSSDAQKLSIKRVLRLRVEVFVLTVDAWDVYGAVGSPRVLCR
jgi:hypothetical protein